MGLFGSEVALNVNGLLGSAVVEVVPLANIGLFSSVVVDKPNKGLFASLLAVFAGCVKKFEPNVELVVLLLLIVGVVSVFGAVCTVGFVN